MDCMECMGCMVVFHLTSPLAPLRQVVPRCGSVAAIMDADSVKEAVLAAAAAYSDALMELVLQSHVSLAFTLLLFAFTFAFAKGGEWAGSIRLDWVYQAGLGLSGR